MEDALRTMAAQSLSNVLVLSAPTVLAGLGVGFLISLFQAVTQIQEQTLTFVPKIIVVFVVLLLTGSWMVGSITDFSHETLKQAAELARS